jgi:hypothetical protein
MRERAVNSFRYSSYNFASAFAELLTEPIQFTPSRTVAFPAKGLMFRSDLLLALESKLIEIAPTVKSAEFSRQCLLARHNLRSLSRNQLPLNLGFPSSCARRATFGVAGISLDFLSAWQSSQIAQTFINRTRQLSWQGRLGLIDRLPFTPRSPVELLLSKSKTTEPYVELRFSRSANSNTHHWYGIDQLLVFQYVSSLIDKVAEYWREVVSARETFKQFSIGTRLRQRLATSLRFKALHTPLQITPSSLHPNELAPVLGC